MKNDLSFINVYSKKNLKSKVVTQLLYGETFKRIKENKNSIKIKNDIDGYKGFVKLRKFPKYQKSTHKTCNLISKLYSRPNLKYEIKQKLSFGSKVKVIKKKITFINLTIFG